MHNQGRYQIDWKINWYCSSVGLKKKGKEMRSTSLVLMDNLEKHKYTLYEYFDFDSINKYVLGKMAMFCSKHERIIYHWNTLSN